jgi:hypothetical protein
MNLTTKLAVSAALLSAAAVSQAQVAVPTPPALFPTAPGSLQGGSANGGLIVQAFDPLTGASLTEYTGLNFNDIQPSVTGTPGKVDFGVLGGTALWSATFGSDTNPIDFVVVSANNAVSGSTSVLTTFGTVPASVRNPVIANAAAGFNTGVGILTKGQQSTPGQAAGVNPAQTLATSDNGFIAVQAIGENLHNTLSGIDGLVGGTGVGFYKVTQNGTGAFTNGTITAYSNSSGIATWAITSGGDVTFTVPGSGAAPVPLPAAIWLLGSGLLGFAGIGRRRAAAALA